MKLDCVQQDAAGSQISLLDYAVRCQILALHFAAGLKYYPLHDAAGTVVKFLHISYRCILQRGDVTLQQLAVESQIRS